mmetsp:Transcript_82986/g.96982  ORF Transcript_82986/g.96982 Transcript_82986/m.96982 type:complete len:318 (+) Transcript_82986:71-1024(+)
MSATIPKEFIKQVRAKTPTILEVGKAPPKAVLSFGGAGFLVTYSLGVALYLQQEKKELLAKSFLLGAGTGCIPATALACGPQTVSIDKVRDFIVDHRFLVSDETQRLKAFSEGLDTLLPKNAVSLVNGRLALTIGFSNKDPGYMSQQKENIHFGHHIATWDSYDDLKQCITVATAPNMDKQMPYRDAPRAMRGTLMSLSSELDQYCRHVHIHGYAGYRYNRQQARHNFFFGRHGFIANTHFGFPKQVWLAFLPHLGSGAKDRLLEAFDAGYNDARRYERWEEDPYHYAKSDRSPSDDFNWKNIRANLFSKSTDRFEL